MLKAHKRIAFLDGLRGIAILLVVLYHAYARWVDVLPFGNGYANFPLFRFGWIGVELFFMISGFVILMTLENCSSFKEFLFRRWARLFPAMLVCSILVFCTALPERPSGLPELRDLVPGLTFVDPAWIEALTGSKQGVLEGAFWSIFVEFKFYIIFGMIYFFLSRRAALISLAVIYALGSRLMNYIVTATKSDVLGVLYDTADLASGRYYAWFLFGALLYIYYKKPGKTALLWVALSSILAILPVCLVLILFFMAVYSVRLQKFLCYWPFLLLGFISYPLYLLHENAVVALTVRLDRSISIPGLILPIAPIAAVMAIAWAVARYVEPWIRHRLKIIYVRREVLA